MEISAALEGLRAVPPGSRVCVVTDSRYLHDGMTSWMAGWKRKGWKTAAGRPSQEQADLGASSRRGLQRPRARALALGQGARGASR